MIHSILFTILFLSALIIAGIWRYVRIRYKMYKNTLDVCILAAEVDKEHGNITEEKLEQRIKDIIKYGERLKIWKHICAVVFSLLVAVNAVILTYWVLLSNKI